MPADFADWLDFVTVIALLAFAWDAPPVAFASFAVAMGLPYVTLGLVAALSEAATTLALLTAPFLGAALATATSVGAAYTGGAALMWIVAALALILARRFAGSDATAPAPPQP